MNSLDFEQTTPRDRHESLTGTAPTWLDWFAAHAWWTALTAGALLCGIAVALT